ncbi:hypothetical protein THARTR1_02307 [Trichoderma harzianum]|uniref:Uncharacterized protein n=1 Tax=Trichoderma harzianum TaxID=5544 RepID=A0A2K0UK27_TRIHA|nr:hypothetical protein THARTR1_02307 [Trichoderma harzianum]
MSVPDWLSGLSGLFSFLLDFYKFVGGEAPGMRAELDDLRMRVETLEREAEAAGGGRGTP